MNKVLVIGMGQLGKCIRDAYQVYLKNLSSGESSAISISKSSLIKFPYIVLSLYLVRSSVESIISFFFNLEAIPTTVYRAALK